MGNHQGTRWRGKLPIPERAHPLIRQFVTVLNAEKTTISDVARRVNLRRCTISNWRYRHTPKLADFEAALNALDYELCMRPRQE